MLEKLSACPLFQDIRAEEIPGLLRCLGAVRREYAKGEIILTEGQPTDQLGVVLSGMAVVQSSDIWGNNGLLGHAGPGAVFAEAYACLPGEPLLISVMAAEDTAVLFIKAGRVLTACSEPCSCHTRLARNLLTVCAARNVQLSHRILHTRSKSIRGRLMSYFSECARRSGKPEFQLPYSRQQLADYLGVDRSAMCSELSRMQRDGLIRYHKNQFQLIEPGMP